MKINQKIHVMVYLLLLTVGFETLIAQDVVNPPALPNVISGQSGSNPSIQKTQSKFILGWNWGGPCRTLDSVLKINTYHDFPFGSSDVGDSIMVITLPGDGYQKTIGSRQENRLSNALSIHLKPTLSLDSEGTLLYESVDNTQSIFGFKTRRYGISQSSGVDANKYVLTKSATSTRVNALSNIYDGSIMRWLDYQESNSDSVFGTSHEDKNQINSAVDKANYHHFNGKQQYLSINLRAINPTELTNNLNNTILTLKLKYTLYLGQKKAGGDSTTTGYIRFNKFPNIADTALHPIRSTVNNDLRGYCRSLSEQPFNAEFAITGAMLKNALATAPNNTITLSAFANLTGKKTNGIYDDNPVLKYDYWSNYGGITNYITRLDVEVDYHGKVDVAIDWVRIETPRAQLWLRGAYDETIRNGVEWALEAARNNPTHPKIFRFYGNDELIPSEWQAMKYYNGLVDGMLAIEQFYDPTQPNLSNKYLYNTKINELWSGSTLDYELITAVPYIRNGFRDAQNAVSPLFLNYRMGYTGNNYFPLSDTLNSNYETYLNGYNKTIPIPVTDAPFKYSDWQNPKFNWNYGTLFNVEKSYWNTYNTNTHMLYGSKPWFANIWYTSGTWKVFPNTIDRSKTYFSLESEGCSRPRTGEESRLIINFPIIMGAKGMFYWINKTSSNLVVTINGDSVYKPVHLGLLPVNMPITNLAGDAYVLSDLLGGDYMKPTNDPNGFSQYFNARNYDLTGMGIDRNHIYLGLRSSRFEIMKLNKWIDRIESNKIAIPSLYQESLMDLRLVAWKGKGFTTMESQDPTYMVAGMSSGISTMATLVDKMNLYIKKEYIQTAKLWQPNGGSLNNNYRNAEVNAYVNRWENADSSFYDVTILRPKNFAIGDLSRFYIGVQNRRTDPLVWDISTNPGRVKFYSTAEYYDGCHSDDFNTCLYFNEYYWKKMGCRIIRIPLSDKFALIPNTRFAVQVKEIMYDDWTFNSDNYKWRNMNWCHLPSIYVAGSASITTPAPIIDIKLQPGEGKLLKVEKLIVPIFIPANSKTLSNEETPLNMELAMSRNDSLVFDVVFENNTKNKAEQLGIILTDEVGEPISIQQAEGIQIADYMEENKIIPNSKVIIIRELNPKSKTVIGQVSCSKKNPAKFTYFLDVVNQKNERGSYKMAASMNKFTKKSTEGIESIDNKVSNISIAPNPAKDMAELHFTATEQGNAEIIVVDILGNQLLRISDYIAYPGANSLNINLSNFSGGVYNVIVKTISGVSTQKFSVVK